MSEQLPNPSMESTTHPRLRQGEPGDQVSNLNCQRATGFCGGWQEEGLISEDRSNHFRSWLPIYFQDVTLEAQLQRTKCFEISSSPSSALLPTSPNICVNANFMLFVLGVRCFLCASMGNKTPSASQEVEVPGLSTPMKTWGLWPSTWLPGAK